MYLSELFQPDFIKIGLEAEDKEEVFEELVDQFCHGAKSDARDDILSALREREAKMSTGIRQGIAIPHGKTNAVSEVCGVLGISKKGIEYEALDDKPVYLLFMILAPELEAEKHLRVLKRLAELLDNPQFYTELLAQRDAQGAHGIIKKYEDFLIDRN
ncbi:MAG: PTS sugar transporter subunit IIA [Spirochaetaceae bacterium]|jgi:PTS system fructose-specific IIC component/PTS system nitrogen regulatory IIA component|nr:PTS sugar transporter subunit IIA [Spirochaetaceae bacterium]